MDTPGDAGNLARPRSSRLEAAAIDWVGLVTGVLGAVLVVYLALENGGYDPIPRDQVGIVVWWGLLLGIGTQALPLPGRTRVSLAAIGLLLAFAAWTALSLNWTQSSERTANELARVVTYLGVFVLGVCLATRRRAGARHLLAGVTIGLASVAALGVLSRLHMAWFPENELGEVLPGIEIERRLAYPLGYSSAMGALAGMTVPLLLAATASARTIAVRSLAAAAIPVTGLALYLATSGAGAVVAATALTAFLLLSPDRLPKILTLLAGAGGAAVLCASVAQREALARGLPTPAAEQQGNEVIWIAIAACLCVALLQAGLALALRRFDRPGLVRVDRRRALIAAAAALAIAIPIGIAAGLPHTVSHRWEVFKSHGGKTRAAPSSAASILDSTSGGRYQYWQGAIDAGKSAPWEGIGPGTFEFWWERHGAYHGFVRNAHSLYLEAFAELGIVGLLLTVAFVLFVLGAGTARALRAPPETRLLLAAATAGAAGFAMAAALDWVWQLAALAVPFMLLAAVAVSGWSLPEPTRRRRRSRRRRGHRIKRVGVALGAVLALLAIWFPLSGAVHLRQSQVDAAEGDLDGALGEAEDAAGAQPYAASPRLQEALVLEQQGKLAAAAAAARLATEKEAANWRNWMVLARIEAGRGRVDPALRAYRRARTLNPEYTLFK